MKSFLQKMRLYSEALADLDDPRGEHLLNLEARVRGLESEISHVESRLEEFLVAPGRQDAALASLLLPAQPPTVRRSASGHNPLP